MVRLRPYLAPVHLMHCARWAMVPALGGLLLLAACWPVSPAVTAAALYAFTMILHLACPRYRSSDLSAIVAIWATVLVSLSGEPAAAAAWRWLSALAAIGLAILPMKVARMRARMVASPFRPLRALDRRRRHAPATPVEQVLTPAPLALAAPTVDR